MNFKPLKLAGAYLAEIKKIEDNRGFFARGWGRDDFESLGLNPDIAQTNIAWNRVKGTLRGMHFQLPPHAETKFVRCTRGALYDVIVDLRPESPTLHEWVGVELTAENYLALYVPQGFGHGYQTLADDTEVSYMTTAFYAPQAAQGVPYNDPAFGIKWPLPVSEISENDKKWVPIALRSKEVWPPMKYDR